MTEREIQMDILRVCKVAGHDSDFNVVGFYALCDRLKQLGAEEEREACAEVAMTLTRRMKETEKAHYNHSAEPFIAERFGFERGLILEGQKIADAIRARGQA